MYCPRHKDTPRQFECTRLITADQVKAAIRRIPAFDAAAKAMKGQRQVMMPSRFGRQCIWGIAHGR
jgi:hypothetical protein